jgi:hypothetical protein
MLTIVNWQIKGYFGAFLKKLIQYCRNSCYFRNLYYCFLSSFCQVEIINT